MSASNQTFGKLLDEGIKKLSNEWNIGVGQAHQRLAQKINYGYSTVHNWRKGQIPPDRTVLIKIAEILVKEGKFNQLWIDEFFFEGDCPVKLKEAFNEKMFGTQAQVLSQVTELTPSPHYIFILSPSFYVESIRSWRNDFFQWDKIPNHMRSTWDGRFVYTLSQLGKHISFRFFLHLFIVLAIYLTTYCLVTPILHWPLENETALWQPFLKYGTSTLLIPILVASILFLDVLITTRGRYQDYELNHWKRHLTLWLLQLQGAAIGFWVLSAFLVLMALIWYYFYMSPFSLTTRKILVIIPLFFSYIIGRRIPSDNYKMLKGKLEFRDDERLFTWVNVFIGSCVAVSFYTQYHNFIMRTTGVNLLILTIGILIWVYRFSIPEPIIIATLGILMPITMVLVSIFFPMTVSESEIITLPLLLIWVTSQYSLVVIFSVRYKSFLTDGMLVGIWARIGIQSLIIIYNFELGYCLQWELYCLKVVLCQTSSH